MLAFASNSLLCRAALRDTTIDPATFSTVRIVSGAVVLGVIARARSAGRGSGSWVSALALFGYVAAFSFAYVSLSAATGALLLFGSVQATMIGFSLASGERLRPRQIVGLCAALGGLVGLLLPGLSAPPWLGSSLMLAAGVAWGIYSLRGKRRGGDPTRTTAENFLRAVPFTLAVSAFAVPWLSIDPIGAVYALLSGAIASGVGYAIWYTALRGLAGTQAAAVQLSVPVIAALGGVLLLGERPTARLAIAAVAILGGIWLMIWSKVEESPGPKSQGGKHGQDQR
jgi:drug/metabolite transporter (DMT)-like permease